MLHSVLPFTAKVFGRALVMPNLPDPITDAAKMVSYRREIILAAEAANIRGFRPLMTIYLTDKTTPAIIVEARDAGAVAAKLYIRGTTMNSHQAVTDIWALRPVFEKMQKVGMILCIHGEKPVGLVLDWEEAFLPDLRQLSREFPAMKIVLEHVSTAAAVECVKSLPNVAATVTPNHLGLTLNDIVGFGQLRPHNFCMPLPKRETDRLALTSFVTSDHPRCFLGTDTAPHAKEKKECACGSPGIFNAPAAMAFLAQVFEDAGCLDRLEGFASRKGALFYDLPLNPRTITLEVKRIS